MPKDTTRAASASSSVVKSGKTAPAVVTKDTVQQLERAGSSESAKIAQALVKK